MFVKLIGWGLVGLTAAVYVWRVKSPVRGCEDVKPEKLTELLADKPNAKIVDVRTEREYRSGHMDRAISRPLGEIEDWAQEFGIDDPLVLVCASGNRSRQAARDLVKRGHKYVYNLLGGMNRWTGPVK